MLLSVSTGIVPTNTFGLPGIHGVGVTGTQGIGVKTPKAAAVAAATAGLAGDVHMAKGGMFTKGLLSMMFATGVFFITRFSGVTIRDDGAKPQVHFNTAPMGTIIAMCLPFFP